VAEAIVYEITGIDAQRILDKRADLPCAGEAKTKKGENE